MDGPAFFIDTCTPRRIGKKTLDTWKLLSRPANLKLLVLLLLENILNFDMIYTSLPGKRMQCLPEILS